MPGSPIGFQLVGYLAIVLGALLWWFGITYFVNKVRTRFNLRGIWILNRDWYCSDADFSRRFHLYYFRKNDVLTKKHILCIIRWFFNFLIINFNLKYVRFQAVKERI